MSNQLEKLKSSIKTEYVKQFEINLMKSSGFIPVDKRQNNFYVIINKNFISNKDSIADVVKKTLGDIQPQFIPVESNDFNEIFEEIISSKENPQSEEAENDSEKQELSPEDMLVGIGWITESQLAEAKKFAMEKLCYSIKHIMLIVFS